MALERKPKQGQPATVPWRRRPAEWLAAVLGAALVVIVGASVVFRYVLNTGIDWGDEVARLLFIWVVFVGAYLAYQRQAHVAVTALRDRLPARVRPYHALVVGLLEAAFFGVVTVYGTVLVADTARFGQRAAGLQVPMAWYYVVMPVTGLMMTVQILTDAFRAFRNRGA